MTIKIFPFMTSAIHLPPQSPFLFETQLWRHTPKIYSHLHRSKKAEEEENKSCLSTEPSEHFGTLDSVHMFDWSMFDLQVTTRSCDNSATKSKHNYSCFRNSVRGCKQLSISPCPSRKPGYCIFSVVFSRFIRSSPQRVGRKNAPRVDGGSFALGLGRLQPSRGLEAERLFLPASTGGERLDGKEIMCFIMVLHCRQGPNMQRSLIFSSHKVPRLQGLLLVTAAC